MTEKFQSTQGIHAGRNIKRLREMMGIKQEALAIALGAQWNQQRVSLLEKRMDIDIELLERVADALRVPIDAIVNLDDDSLVNIITSNLTEKTADNDQLSFNVAYKWLETLEENRKLTRKLIKAKDKLIKCLKKRIDCSCGE